MVKVANKKFSLSDKEMQILLLTQSSADKSISSFKDDLNISEHQLRRAITKFRQLGLYKPLPIVNLSVLGYSRFQLLFSITKNTQVNLKNFKKLLITHRLVYFFCEIGGDYQYMIGVQARGLKELQDFLQEFSSIFDGCFSEQEILPVVGMTFIGTGTLSSGLARPRSISWQEQSSSVELDEVSKKILHYYCNSTVYSVTELSRIIRIPKSTVHYRLSQLEEQGVIVGYFNAFDPVDLGMFPFNILISFRGLTEERESKLRKIADKRREVDTVVKNLGSWNFTLICFVAHARSISPVVEEIRAEFGNTISRITVLPQFHTFKWVEYSYSD